MPVVLIVPTYRQSDALVQAWNEGLGKPFDLVCTMHTPEDLKDTRRLEATLALLKVGAHTYWVPSFAAVERGDAEIPSSARWLSYDPEPWGLTPKEELADMVATAQAVQAFCRRHGLKVAVTPIYSKFEDSFSLERVRQLAPYYDAYILQCQDLQKDPAQRLRATEFLRAAKDAIHGVNPDCLVGCQLGACDSYGAGEPSGGVVAAMQLYESTRNTVEIYSVWWEPEEQNMIRLLRAMDAPTGG